MLRVNFLLRVDEVGGSYLFILSVVTVLSMTERNPVLFGVLIKQKFIFKTKKFESLGSLWILDACCLTKAMHCSCTPNPLSSMHEFCGKISIFFKKISV